VAKPISGGLFESGAVWSFEQDLSIMLASVSFGKVPGGEIKQTFSHFQQKIMWQWSLLQF
jgi:hypothetical protein